MDFIAHVQVEIAVPFAFDADVITEESDDAHQEKVLKQRSQAAKHAEKEVVKNLKAALSNHNVSNVTVTLVEEAQ